MHKSAYNFRFSEVNMASTVAVICCLVLALTISNVHSATNYYGSAIVESCGGCSLKRLPDVQNFIYKDVPNYENVEFKHIQGAVPELVLFDHDNLEVERLPLSRLTRDECNELLTSKGFTKKPVKDEI